MIAFEKAVEIVNNQKFDLKSEKVHLHESLNRVLAEDIFSDINMPPFDKSAVDGFACKKEDLSNSLEIIELIQAGAPPQKTVGKNQAAKIMTGAMMPKGADSVFMVEESKVDDNFVKYTGEKPKDNICYLGEDLTVGVKVMSKGTLIKAQHIPILATAGISEPLVFCKPKIGILATGDELVEPENKPSVSQIRNSNGHQLVAQVIEAGAIPNYYGIVNDTQESLRKAIAKSIEENNMIILTGGVSKGDYDFVPDIIKETGAEIHFHTVAVQPGKPTLFASKDTKYCYGLPGNPVSSFVQFELLVKPLIYKFMGTEYKPIQIPLEMAHEYTRRKSARRSFIPVLINKENLVEVVNYHGSAHINSLENAVGLISLPVGITKIEKGEIVYVRQI